MLHAAHLDMEKIGRCLYGLVGSQLFIGSFMPSPYGASPTHAIGVSVGKPLLDFVSKDIGEESNKASEN